MGSIHGTTKLRNNLGKVVLIYVPLSPSSIPVTWYWLNDGDILQFGRWPQVESNGSLPPGRWHKKSPACWLPVHRDQLWGQRSVTSMGELYLTSAVWLPGKNSFRKPMICWVGANVQTYPNFERVLDWVFHGSIAKRWTQVRNLPLG